jgi:SAM-dependent methyltransferase
MARRPENYGDWWRTHPHGAEWYAEIFAARQVIHAAFAAWVKATEAETGEPFNSVLEVGCGCAVHYPDVFAGRRYMGFDFSQKEIDWCLANRSQAGRDFLCGDFIDPAQRPRENFDLVYSHAVVDHVYDIEAFIIACANQCKAGGWIYLTSYRGWFPGIARHVYAWDEWTTCFYNSISPERVQQQLTKISCTHVEVRPIDTGKPEIPQETLIIARVR